MPYYHCTKLKYARLIETAGFTTDYSWLSFFGYADEYAALYGRRTRDRIVRIQERLERAADDLEPEEELRLLWKLDAFYRQWLRDWGDGTMIWVSDQGPQTMFGGVCFEVKKPPGTKSIIYGGLWWAPIAPIPPEYFRRIS